VNGVEKRNGSTMDGPGATVSDGNAVRQFRLRRPSPARPGNVLLAFGVEINETHRVFVVAVFMAAALKRAALRRGVSRRRRRRRG